MDYEKFKEEFVERVREELEEMGINFEERDILKNNGQHMDGLVVSKDEGHI